MYTFCLFLSLSLRLIIQIRTNKIIIRIDTIKKIAGQLKENCYAAHEYTL